MNKAEIALPLPEEAKKVGDIVAYSNLEAQEIIATNMPMIITDLIKIYNLPSTSVDEKIKIVNVCKSYNVDKVKAEDKVQQAPVVINITRRARKETIDVQVKTLDDFNVIATPSMDCAEAINVDINYDD
jgi:hypothetical protein